MDLFKQEKQYIISTYNRFPIVADKGINGKIYSKDGAGYIDFASGIGVNCLGCGHKKWVAAVTEQLEKFAHVSNLFYIEPQITLAEKLAAQSKMSKVFFANTGTEANEGAFKLARKYSFEKYGAGRHKIISLTNSFHGRTLFALEATGQSEMHTPFLPMTGGFYYAQPNNIADFESKLTGDVCAAVLESVQGEGGVYPLEQDFVSEVANLCHQKDVLLIFDEIQTGIGRVGKFWGFQHYDVYPDIITCAKALGGGLPIGAFLVNEKLKDVFRQKDHGSTFGGNPAAAAGANVVMDIVSDEEFLRDVAEKGNYLKSEINKIRSPLIKEVRGVGLMIGIDIADGKVGEIYKNCYENGLLVLTAGKNAIRFLPPLIISKKEIDEGIEIFKEALNI